MSINPESWTHEEVAYWIAGLESNHEERAFACYAACFHQEKVTGRLLLSLMAGDLLRYGVNRVGDQLLLQDAIQALRSELETPRTTLQSLASALAVRCKNYRAELSLLGAENGIAVTPSSQHQHHNNQQQQQHHHQKIPTESLSSASYLLDCSKVLIRWLTRFPFLGRPEYDDITMKLTKHCFELAMLSQRDSFADNAIEEVQYLCTKIIEICEGIVNSKDSLVIQPAAVDVITLRKRTEQDLGLQLESSYFGLHQVSGVTLSSPAQQSGHLEKGDEILQVNYQTVVGWPQANVVNLLDENSNEVILTIKRRPRHAAANILGHMYLRPSNKLMGSTHRSQKRHRPKMGQHGLSPSSLAPSSLTLPSSRRHQKSMPISPVPEDENSSSSTTSSSANSPVVVVNVKVSTGGPSITEDAENADAGKCTATSGDDSSSTPHLTTEQSLDTMDSDDMAEVTKSPGLGLGITSGSGSGSEDTQSASIKSPNRTSAHSKFWDLYPRPRNLIRRRATVTGASPTSTRPPVTFFDEDGADTGKLRPPLINSKSAPEKIRIGIRKQGHVDNVPSLALHRQTMPASVDIDIFTAAVKSEDEHRASRKETKTANLAEESQPASTEADDKIPSTKTVTQGPTAAEVNRQNATEQERLDRLSSQESTEDHNRKEEVKCTSKPVPAPRPPRKFSAASVDTEASTKMKAASDTSQVQRRSSSEKPIPKRRGSTSVSPEKGRSPSTEKDPNILLKGILHLRQSPVNLLVKSNSLTSTLSSGSGTGFSPHPRWTRHPAVLTATKTLQIGSDPDGSLVLNLSNDTSSICEVSLAKEVHSRPFAFKIDIKVKTKLHRGATEGDKEKPSGIFYLAAESQQDYEIWMRHLLPPEVCETVFRTPSSSGIRDLMYQKLRASAPPVFKRSISLGNSPAYTRRSNSLMCHSSSRPAGDASSGSSGSINDPAIHHNRSFILRKNNLVRSSKLIGNSSPNVQALACATTPTTPQYPSSKPTVPVRKNSEMVKSEWFNSPTSNSTTPRKFFTTSAPPYRSPTSSSAQPTSPILRSATTIGSQTTGLAKSNNSSSNISSITIRSVVRKSETDSPSPTKEFKTKEPMSPESMERMKTRSTSGSRLPAMGVSMVLAKQSQSPLSSPKKTVAPIAIANCSTSTSPVKSGSPTKKVRSSSSSTSSSSDVFLKNDGDIPASNQPQRAVNCPSCGCGGSTSSFSKSDKNVPVREMGTQTVSSDTSLNSAAASGSVTPVSPNLEMLRHMINEEEGSRV